MHSAVYGSKSILSVHMMDVLLLHLDDIVAA